MEKAHHSSAGLPAGPYPPASLQSGCLLPSRLVGCPCWVPAIRPWASASGSLYTLAQGFSAMALLMFHANNYYLRGAVLCIVGC